MGGGGRACKPPGGWGVGPPLAQFPGSPAQPRDSCDGCAQLPAGCGRAQGSWRQKGSSRPSRRQSLLECATENLLGRGFPPSAMCEVQNQPRGESEADLPAGPSLPVPPKPAVHRGRGSWWGRQGHRVTVKRDGRGFAGADPAVVRDQPGPAEPQDVAHPKAPQKGGPVTACGRPRCTAQPR
ncbi:PREDICTED: uncharacterized protein LOC106724742 isoform X2 [Myotis brandtii]|uniref:uncharacterized protein LOC106724742 isoform X2 n=1 Tax=Myotis brandtii TaxID=109478 RepID=UPI0007043F80|nr:PREDICTED: uncharacterized protein LOC106724742 isoform X2 [Myotis brandtii]